MFRFHKRKAVKFAFLQIGNERWNRLKGIETTRWFLKISSTSYREHSLYVIFLMITARLENNLNTGLKGGSVVFSATSLQLTPLKKGCALIASTNFRRLFLSLYISYKKSPFAIENLYH